MGGTAKTSAMVLLDTVARLGDDGGCVDSAVCSTAVLGRRQNRAREEEEEALEGGMDRDGRETSPGARRRHGEAWKVLGGDVSSTAGAGALHPHSWESGRGGKI